MAFSRSVENCCSAKIIAALTDTKAFLKCWEETDGYNYRKASVPCVIFIDRDGNLEEKDKTSPRGVTSKGDMIWRTINKLDIGKCTRTRSIDGAHGGTIRVYVWSPALTDKEAMARLNNYIGPAKLKWKAGLTEAKKGILNK